MKSNPNSLKPFVNCLYPSLLISIVFFKKTSSSRIAEAEASAKLLTLNGCLVRFNISAISGCEIEYPTRRAASPYALEKDLVTMILG